MRIKTCADEGVVQMKACADEDVVQMKTCANESKGCWIKRGRIKTVGFKRSEK
jgi:hypothetical protein